MLPSKYTEIYIKHKFILTTYIQIPTRFEKEIPLQVVMNLLQDGELTAKPELTGNLAFT